LGIAPGGFGGGGAAFHLGAQVFEALFEGAVLRLQLRYFGGQLADLALLAQEVGAR
jgi:hypothetical protein